jgi:ABC-2 type transport system permease protein
MNWYHIVVKDLKIILLDRLAWSLMIVVPLVVLTIAGFALSGFGSKVPDLNLAYAYSGNAENIEPLMHSFESMEAMHLLHVDSKEEGIKLIEKSSVTAMIVIPNDFKVNNINSKYIIDFYYDLGSQSKADIIKGMVQGVVKTLNDSLVSIELLVNQSKQYSAVQQETIPQIVSKVSDSFHKTIKVGMAPHGIGGDESKRSFYQVIPGFAVMFLLFSVLGGAGKLIEERQNKTLRRILIAPVNKSDVIIGKWVGMTIEGFCQAMILFVAGKLIFNLSLGSNPFRLFFFLLVVAGATGAIGIFIASIVTSIEQANGLAMLLFMLMSALGGSWWPIEITPPFIQTMGKFTLNYWAITGVKKLILFNQPLSGVAFEMIILALVGSLFLVLSSKYFKYE